MTKAVPGGAGPRQTTAPAGGWERGGSESGRKQGEDGTTLAGAQEWRIHTSEQWERTESRAEKVLAGVSGDRLPVTWQSRTYLELQRSCGVSEEKREEPREMRGSDVGTHERRGGGGQGKGTRSGGRWKGACTHNGMWQDRKWRRRTQQMRKPPQPQAARSFLRSSYALTASPLPRWSGLRATRHQQAALPQTAQKRGRAPAEGGRRGSGTSNPLPLTPSRLAALLGPITSALWRSNRLVPPKGKGAQCRGQCDEGAPHRCDTSTPAPRQCRPRCVLRATHGLDLCLPFSLPHGPDQTERATRANKERRWRENETGGAER